MHSGDPGLTDPRPARCAVLTAISDTAPLSPPSCGIAVIGTMLITGILFSREWHRRARPTAEIVLLLGLVLAVDLGFLAANLVKIPKGGWFPLTVASALVVVMANWHTGHDRVARRREEQEGPVEDYVAGLEAMGTALRRVPGMALFLTRPGDATAPALHTVVERIHALHEHVVIVTVEVADVPRVRSPSRFRSTCSDISRWASCAFGCAWGSTSRRTCRAPSGARWASSPSPRRPTSTMRRSSCPRAR